MEDVTRSKYRAKVDGKVVLAKFSSLQTLTKTHYYHVVEHGGDWWEAHTFFRDYLNEHLEVARQYETLKKDLALSYANDELTYTNKKKTFVDEVLSYRNK
ncbi:GrpB family protein [Oceanobacillus bengalensis]|uniref:GrpB family protein n=1 Tax=Oceanobacillus bengalensis TaxID=1435466 RepID=UPI0024827730|nr:GrpB family protein [Oceanobacillus bengalensis]